MALDIVLPISVKRIEKSTWTRLADRATKPTHDAGYAAGYEEGKLRGEWGSAPRAAGTFQPRARRDRLA